MTALESLKAELAAFAAKKEELIVKLRDDFSSLVVPFFERSKLIESISWTQYTPYFNDGDTCEFGCNCGDLDINGEYKYDVDWYDSKVGSEYYQNYQPDNSDVDVDECLLIKEMEEALESVPEELYKDLFGDHARVTIFRDGTLKVEEYEHD
jgi:hypothetical protein